MAPRIPAYDSLAAFVTSLGKPSPSVEGLSAHRIEALHPEAPYASPLFRAQYYSLVLVAAGRGTYVLNGTPYDTRPGTVYFTNPGHIKGFTIEEPIRGYVLTFTEAFLKEHVHADIFKDLPFLIAETAPPFYADAAPFAELAALAEQMLAEYARPSSVRAKVLASLLVVLLLRFREAFWKDYDPVAEGQRSSAIVTVFKQTLEARFRALVQGQAAAPPSVAELADAQGLHPNYLSTVIREKTGRTVRAWLADKLVAEAKAQLTATRHSIKEIAATLGFSEPNHFARFFKRETGYAPSDYRRLGAAPP